MSYLPASYDPRLLRASDEDRERTVYLLGQALTTGRLTPAEHAERVSRALVAKTYGDLETISWDLAPAPRAPATHYWPPPGYALAPPPLKRTNTMAILAFILSLVAVVAAPLVIGGFFAVLVGFRARGEVLRSQGEQEGEGLAMAGIVIGIIAVFISVAIYGARFF